MIKNGPLLEAVKEFGRMVVVAVITAFAAAIFVVVAGIDVGAGAVNVQWNVVVLGFLSYVLSAVGMGLTKALDKFLHESAKDTPKADRNEGLGGVKGLTGF